MIQIDLINKSKNLYHLRNPREIFFRIKIDPIFIKINEIDSTFASLL